MENSCATHNGDIAIGRQKHLPLTTERLDKLTESYVVSNHKIKKALSKALPINAKEGLRKTIESF